MERQVLTRIKLTSNQFSARPSPASLASDSHSKTSALPRNELMELSTSHESCVSGVPNQQVRVSIITYALKLELGCVSGQYWYLGRRRRC